MSTRSDARRAAVILAAVAVVTSVAIAAPAAGGPPADTAEAEHLRSVERARMQALVDADVATAAQLHAEEFQLIPPPGVPLSRDEYLGAVAAGAIDYHVFEPISEIQIRMYGSAAVLRYLSRIDVTVAGLGHFAAEAWHTYVYEKSRGEWQAVWEQATTVGGFPPPPSG